MCYLVFLVFLVYLMYLVYLVCDSAWLSFLFVNGRGRGLIVNFLFKKVVLCFSFFVFEIVLCV